jgi:hypothetical protein
LNHVAFDKKREEGLGHVLGIVVRQTTLASKAVQGVPVTDILAVISARF